MGTQAGDLSHAKSRREGPLYLRIFKKEALMTEQLRRPTDQVEVYWFSEQPNGYVTDQELEKYDSGRLGFPNTHFDPEKAHLLYNEYHEQYALADEVGFDGIMTNEHHAASW